MKRFWCVLLSIAMFFSALPALAADNDEGEAANDDDELQDSIILLVGANSCYVNGELTSVGDVNPIVVDGRTLVPARFLAESLGGEAEWIDESKTAVLTVDSDVIEIPIDTNTIVVNGLEQQLDVGGTILNDRTMMPLRSICEALGKNVEYEDGIILIGNADFSQMQNGISTTVSSYILRNASQTLDLAENNQNRLIQTLAETELCINGDSFFLPYESEKNTCLYSVGGMYVENMTINKSGVDKYLFTMDVYNTDFSYGAVEIYENNGDLYDVECIEPFDGGANTANVGKYLTTVWDYALNVKNAVVNSDFSYIEYRNDSVSKETSLSFEVPYDGYILITSSSNDSYYVGMYNSIYAITETIVLLTNIVGSLSSDEKDTLKQVTKDYLKAMLIENKDRGIRLTTNICAAIEQTNFTPWNFLSVLSDLGQDILDIIKSENIDIEKIVKESTGGTLSTTIQDKVLKVIKASGIESIKIGFDIGDAISSVTNLACFFLDFSYTTGCDPIVIDLAPYKAAYKKFLLESDDVDRANARFTFIYVDDNDVPELVVANGSAHVSRADLYTYVDDEVKPVCYDDSHSYGDYGSIMYKERKSIIIKDHWINGYGSVDTVYEMYKDTATEMYNVEIIYGEGDNNTYYWNGEKVSQAVYKERTADLREGVISFTYSDGYSVSEKNIDTAFKDLLTK